MLYSPRAHHTLRFSYFNTVGSKEGWAPSQFTSSRGDRRKAESARAQNLPQHFMDEEDLADAAESQRLGTSESFTGIGGQHDSPLTDKFMTLLHVKSKTAGVLLLNRMGWRDGQGIGPRVSRKPRLGAAGIPSDDKAMAMGGSYLFAPDDTATIPFTKKTDRSGLGLATHERPTGQYLGETGADGGHKPSEPRALGGTLSARRASRGRSSGRGFGVGVLNDSSSGEDDPYEIGPKITQIRRVRNQKKTKNFARGKGAVQASLPIHVGGLGPGGTRHGENNPLAGFIRDTAGDIGAGMASQLESSFSVPEWWAPPRRAVTSSAGDNARMHPQASSPPWSKSAARGRMLGEPDTAKQNNLGVPNPNLQSSGSAQATTVLPDQVPGPTRQAAEAALGREQEGRGPYHSQPSKRERYHRYLEYHAGLSTLAPAKPDGMTHLDFSQELVEFYNCVAIFKPMVAHMASRFTAATTSVPAARAEAAPEVSRDKDTPREAARLGMFGEMTRSIVDFTPCSLLCKRFGIAPPRSDAPAKGDYTQPSEAAAPSFSNIRTDGPPRQLQDHPVATGRATAPASASPEKADAFTRDPTGNEQVSEEVFDAIFGNDA